MPPTKLVAGGIEFLYGGGGSTGGEYLNNAGTVTWNGTGRTAGPGVQTGYVDYIEVPVLNTGTFNANGNGDGSAVMGAVLDISGANGTTNNVSFYQTSGALNITRNATVLVEDGYNQTGGQITSDATPCILEAGSEGNGDINIAGGKVIVDTVAGSVSTLTFDSNTVEFNGELDVNGLTKNGGGSTRSDQLICEGAVKLGASSYLNVNTTGASGLGTGNQWTVMTYASITGFWGTTSVPLGMTVSTGATKVLVTN